MISCIHCHNLHRYGHIMTSQYKLRHKAFIDRQSYKVYSYQSMEYDQYDNPSAVYLVYTNASQEALGVSRLTPVSHRSMLKDLYPDMVLNHAIFNSSTIWEGTRFCVEKSLPVLQRTVVVKELVSAYFEFGLANDVSHIIGMMPSYILKRVFGDNGCRYALLGPDKIIDGQTIQAASLKITSEEYQNFQQVSGLHYPVLEDDFIIKEAA